MSDTVLSSINTSEFSDMSSSMLNLYLQDIKKWREDRRILEHSTESLLDPNNKRNSLRPIRWQGIWDYYKLHLSCHWIFEDIDLSKDKNDWLSLTDDERFYIKYGLAFFAGSDFIINKSQKKDQMD